MFKRNVIATGLGGIFWLLASLPATAGKEDSAKEQVLAAETAFAATMSKRDFKAFGEFLDDEAVFFSDAGVGVLHGKQQVLDHWRKFFTGANAPFSWAPDQAEVLASGDLALSTGLVRDARGNAIVRFNSIWRQVTPGRWRVVFDKGSPLGQDISATEEQIKQLERDRQDAFVRGDLDALERETADDYTTINGSGKLSTKPQMMQNLHQGKTRVLSVALDDMRARIYGNTAVLTGEYRDEILRDGVKGETHARFMRIFELSGGRWQAVAYQQTPIIGN